MKLNFGPPPVLLAQPLERPLALPEVEDLELERRVIGLVRQGCEHALDSREQSSAGSVVFNQ